MPKVVWKKAYDGTARCLIDGVFSWNRDPKNHTSKKQDMGSEDFYRDAFFSLLMIVLKILSVTKLYIIVYVLNV